MTRLNPNWLMTVATAFGAVSLAACGAHDGDPGASEVDPVAETEQAVIATAVTSQVSSNFTVRAGATVTATATCPSNSKVVAGGYATFSGFLGLRVIESRPNSSNGWQIKVVNNNPDVFSLSGSVSAECLSGTRATAVTPFVSTGIRIDPGKQNCAVAQCADTGVTEVLTGVGFSSTSAFELTSITQAGTPRFFTVCGRNTNPVNPIQVQAVSSCVRGVTGGVVRQQTAPVTVRPFTRTSTSITSSACPSGKPLSFGVGDGFDLGVLTVNSQRSGSLWKVDIVNTTAFNSQAKLDTYCLDLFQ